MNLLVSKPDGTEDFLAQLVYSLPFNLNREDGLTNGHLCVTNERIFVYENNECAADYAIGDFTEFKCEQFTGCALMTAVRENGESVCLCAFTYEHFLKFAEVCKLLEFSLKTGALVTDTGAEEPRCPQCGFTLEGAPECPYCVSKGRTLVKLFKRTAPYKNYFIAAILLTVLCECIWVVMPYTTRVIIDDFVTPKSHDWAGMIGITAVVVGLLLIAGIMEFFNMKCSFKVALGLGRDIRQAVFEKTQVLSMTSVSKRTAGELISRVTNDATKLENFVVQNGKDATVKVLSLFIIGGIMFAMNWKLSLLVVLPMPFVLVLTNRLFRVMAVRFTKVWRNGMEHSSLLHDILNGIRVVKTCGTEEKEIVRYTRISKRLADSASNAERMWYFTMPPAQFIASLGSFFVIYFGAHFILDGQMLLGELVQFNIYAFMLYEPVYWLIHIPRELADTSVSAARVFEILEEESELKNAVAPVEVDIRGGIEFDDVYFGYKVYNPVLKGISLKINPGEMIGIVGHSGVGKSTLINLILRLYDCTQGEIRIDGVNIRDIDQHSLRSQVGVVLQETFLFDGSVLDNIAYAKPDAPFEEIIKAAKIANAHDFVTRLPDGYNTRVGNKGYQLSGGERQRIAIARAILHNPKIIILDEATASLDTQTEKQIQDALGKLTAGRTTIAIAHRLSTLSGADRLIVLDKGKLAQFDTHEALMRETDGVYYKLVMAQRRTTRMKKAQPIEKVESAV
ncbi:MAG: ABC transporter ATP-binding protein [Oscillospiraceae bacterium]